MEKKEIPAYEQYALDVESGKIVSCELIKLAVQRYRDYRNRTDVYFDSDAVEDCILFIGQIRHYLGKFSGKPFVLQPWQEFIVACVIGFKWKDTSTRVCRQLFVLMARKNGKSAFAAALSLYMLIADGEMAPEIVFVANSREQARILFTITSEFCHSLDPKGKDISLYRNQITFKANKGYAKVLSSDSSKLDGLNLQMFILDEFHEAKDRKLLDVLASSQGMRTQPLQMIISTAGFNLQSPCKQMYDLSVEVLNKVKEDDSFWPFIFTLDKDDDWTDPAVWGKSNPNLNVTVNEDYIAQEVQKALNDATATVGVKTKTLNIWCSSAISWIPTETIATYMNEVELENYRGQVAYLGVDLGSVSDFTSLSVLVPSGEDFIFKSWTFIPHDTLMNHPDREMYQKFIQEGSMIETPGNCTDYDYVIALMQKLNEVLMIEKVGYDSWNAISWATKCTDLGYPMQPFSQAIGNFNRPTKEFERLLKSGKCVIDTSSNILWQFGNVALKADWNGNVKPAKEAYGNKIDSVISMLTALGVYLENPVSNDFDLFIL